MSLPFHAFVTASESVYGNPYLFTARRWDSATRLYYYRFRDYAPKLGRFLQTDPAGYIDTMNLYAYCGNNPVNWTDPWGLKCDVAGGGGGTDGPPPGVGGSGGDGGEGGGGPPQWLQNLVNTVTNWFNN